MVKFTLLSVSILIFNQALAQQQPNSWLFSAPADTLALNSIYKADSIALTFQTKADSLNAEYQAQLSKITSAQIRLQSQADSLNNLQLPTDKITKKIDSLQLIKNENLGFLTTKVNELKSKTTEAFSSINLPPQLQEPLSKLQTAVQSYSLPNLNGLDDQSGTLAFTKLELPTFTNQLKLDPNITNFTGNLGKVKDLTGQAGQYVHDAQSLAQGSLNEVKEMDKTIENRLSQMEGMDQLKEGSALVSSSRMDSAAIADKAKEMVKEQVMNAAADHFSGKEEILQQAMQKMTKLKGRYSEMKSFAELPKKLPNPLKGKPFIERIVPGITFQIQKSQYFLLDINPMLLYRVSPRISAGAGWNHRLAFDDFVVKKDQYVYGPRGAFEFKWAKGVSLRLLPEIMNTTVPPMVAQAKGLDVAYREWVPSIFAGIKKEFTVYKNIKGNTEVLYNLFDPDGMSPYGDKLSLRFGFESPIKKKEKRIE